MHILQFYGPGQNSTTASYSCALVVQQLYLNQMRRRYIATCRTPLKSGLCVDHFSREAAVPSAHVGKPSGELMQNEWAVKELFGPDIEAATFFGQCIASSSMTHHHQGTLGCHSE